MADAFDTIGDIGDFAGSLNAAVNPFLGNPNLVEQAAAGTLPAIDSCLQDLLVGLLFARRAGLSDIGVRQFTLDALVSPVRDLFSEIFVPDAAAFDGLDGFGAYVQEYASQIAESLKNPIAAVLAQQQQIIASSLDQINKSLFTGDAVQKEAGQQGLIREFANRLNTTIQTMLMGDDDGLSIMGMVGFALEHGIPGIQSEIRYLKQMRRALRTSLEQSSRIPDAVIPQLPALGAVNKICLAVEDLEAVAQELRRSRTWNRSRFSSATESVCESAKILRDGIIPEDALSAIGAVLNFDDRQLNALRSMRFVPDPRFRLSLVQLQALNGFAQQQDVYAVALHRNLVNFVSNLESITSFHVADIMSLMIEVITEQIKGVQADLEAQARGFTGNLAAAFPDSVQEGDRAVQIFSNPPNINENLPSQVAAVRGEEPVQGLVRRNKKYAVDIYAQLSGQASAYAVLETLCFLLKKLRLIYNNIDKLLSFNTKIMAAVKKFITYYGAEDCGPDDGGKRITEALNAYLTAAERRLRNDDTDNRVIARRAEVLRLEIDNHVKWLECIQSRMVFGNEMLLTLITAVANVFAAYQNIRQLIKQFRQLYEMFRTLSIKDILGYLDTEYSALEVILKAIQCFVLQCDNTYFRVVMDLAQAEFGGLLRKRTSEAQTLSTLDATSKNADKSNLNTRIAAFLRLLQNLQRLASMDLNELCAVEIPGTPTPQRQAIADLEEDQGVVVRPVVETRDRQFAEEDRDRIALATAGGPFQSS